MHTSPTAIMDPWRAAADSTLLTRTVQSDTLLRIVEVKAGVAVRTGTRSVAHSVCLVSTPYEREAIRQQRSKRRRNVVGTQERVTGLSSAMQAGVSRCHQNNAR